MTAFLQGFALSSSLILAIGAQNAFVLRQGLRRSHVLAVVVVCSLSDAVLITAGVAGFGVLTRAAPDLEFWMRLVGAAFLIWYGARCFLSAWRGGQVLVDAGEAQSLRAAMLTCLALTWLNPHVYLDTVLLLGSVSAQYAAVPFALGAILASVLFFVALGYGAQFLAPVFARPRAWQFLDLLIGVVMWAIATQLLIM